MGIVVITIPGEAQRTFVNSLHQESRGGVDLVIIKKSQPKQPTFWHRTKKLYRNVGLWSVPTELFYALLLRLRKKTRKTLEYFREHNSLDSSDQEYLPKTLETFSINSNDVFEILQKLSPDLLVVWGNTVIKPHLIKTAKKSINLHAGLCPYYHGAVANQNAVISRQPERIGATIHYTVARVDAGDILETITADLSLPPRELFRDLNDKAKKRYLEIILKLSNGKKLPQRIQDLSLSKNLLLKNWTPKTRYKLARDIIEWEKRGTLE